MIKAQDLELALKLKEEIVTFEKNLKAVRYDRNKEIIVMICSLQYNGEHQSGAVSGTKYFELPLDVGVEIMKQQLLIRRQRLGELGVEVPTEIVK